MAKISKTEQRRQTEQKRVQMISAMGAAAGGNMFALNGLIEMGGRIAARIIANPANRDCPIEVMQGILDANGGYRPTLREDTDPEAGLLADIYDFLQARRGDPRRAYRG